MLWIYLSIFRSILVVLKILYIRYDNTPYIMFPLIINIIAGSVSLVYFSLYFNEHFTTEFSKPKFYIFSVVVLFGNILAYYIIKTCTNPAYFKVFIALQIILLFLATLYLIEKEGSGLAISAQSMAGLLFGCLAILLISLDEANHK